jgi:hypothetical protein
MWAYIGGRILDGALPYHDLWESKPPGIYYTFAVVEWLCGRGGDAAFLWLDAVLTAGVLASTYAAARRFASTPAAAGAVLLLSLVFCHRILADWGNNVEKFVALFETLALLLFLGACPNPLRGLKRRWFGIGACCGAAGLFKQTGCLLFVLLILAQAIAAARDRSRGAVHLTRIGLLILGAAGPWIPALAYMLWQGNFSGFWQQVVLYDLLRAGSADVERSRLATPEHWSQVWEAISLVLILFGPALIGLLTVAVDRARRHAAGEGESGVSARLPLIGVFWVVATMAFVVAPYGYGHYLLQAAPPAALLSAAALDRTRRRPRAGPWLAGMVFALFAGGGQLGDHLRFTFDKSYSLRNSYHQIAERTDGLVMLTRASSRPDQTVMLWPPDYAASYYAQRVTPLEASNSDVIFKEKIGRLSPPIDRLTTYLKSRPPDVIIDGTPVEAQSSAATQPRSPPRLLVPDDGTSFLDEPNEQHPALEGRLLAPLKRWVKENYGGRKRVGRYILYFHGAATSQPK